MKTSILVFILFALTTVTTYAQTESTHLADVCHEEYLVPYARWDSRNFTGRAAGWDSEYCRTDIARDRAENRAREAGYSGCRQISETDNTQGRSRIFPRCSYTSVCFKATALNERQIRTAACERARSCLGFAAASSDPSVTTYRERANSVIAHFDCN